MYIRRNLEVARLQGSGHQPCPITVGQRRAQGRVDQRLKSHALLLKQPRGIVAMYLSQRMNDSGNRMRIVHSSHGTRPGERCVVTSWKTGSKGRRLIAEAALFGEEEDLLAVGRAI